MYMFQTINGWTKQKMMDHVENNFLGKSFKQDDNVSGPICLYRGDDGKKCAVGLFIPDELYKPEFETKSTTCLFRICPDLVQHMPLPEYAMDILQSQHDNSNEIQTTSIIFDWIENNVIDDEVV